MNKEKRKEIFQRFLQANAHPTTELKYHNHFQLLIAVMLSAQATDVSVNKATASLFKKVTTPDQMLQLSLIELKRYIKTIGLFNTKAAHILKTCHILVQQHQSQVPHTRAELEALPGVGRKTANVILNTAFGEPTVAVDTHIFRVANRIGLVCGKTPLEVEKKLLQVIPEEYLYNAHHWLILHGRYVCVARKPKCAGCLINDLCEYKEKTS